MRTEKVCPSRKTIFCSVIFMFQIMIGRFHGMKCKFQTMKYRFVCGAENLGGGFGVFLGLFTAGVGGVAICGLAV